MITAVRTIGLYELGSHRSGGWRQWYVRHIRSQKVGLVDFSDASDAGLPEDLHAFTAADVQTMRDIVWKTV